jgi:hypothetical protein
VLHFLAWKNDNFFAPLTLGVFAQAQLYESPI